jgi:retron-type reverse transcriptase
LFDYQFGLKPKYSMTDALLAIQKAIIDAWNRNEYVCVVVLDLRKAFDIICHKILIFKLTKYGFSRITIKLIESYLGNRKQLIYHNWKTSKFASIKQGLPQGSVISPLLFSIFINDVFKVTIFGLTIFVADDINIIFSRKNFNKLQDIVNTDLKRIFDWLTSID